MVPFTILGVLEGVKQQTNGDKPVIMLLSDKWGEKLEPGDRNVNKSIIVSWGMFSPECTWTSTVIRQKKKMTNNIKRLRSVCIYTK